MFQTLNRFISKLGDEPQRQAGGGGTGDAAGFQVLRNKTAELPLEPWFDFIIGINGRQIDNPDPNLFVTELRNCAGSTVSLGVWSAKGQRVREVFVEVPRESPSVGLSLQWIQLSVTEDVWHILEVTPNSPADLAGLLPYGDYVIGSPDSVLHGEAGLGQFIEQNIDRQINLLVYNQEYDVTRPVQITPSRNWGGQGALGCTLGFGALHRIPPSLEEPPAAPGETMFAASNSFDEKHPPITASDYQPQGEFLVPANLNVTAAPPSGAPPPGPKRDRKARAHHNISPGGGGLDDYFQEGEEKSRAEDHVPKTTNPAGLPPPPKAGGGPPKAKSPVPES